MKYALISVHNKTNIIGLAKSLYNSGRSLISTGGTHKLLSEHFPSDRLFSVSSITEFPEILDGRVKTLHPQIHGSILANRSNPNHLKQMSEIGLRDIDVVVVNLYPFWETTHDTTESEAIELIDIGGVALIRAAAKNYQSISIFTDASQYNIINSAQDEITSLEQRRVLAYDAFKLTSGYDKRIANFFQTGPQIMVEREYVGREYVEREYVEREYKAISQLKYGCNPHQTPAALYTNNNDTSGLKLLNGTWGYINILDAANAWCLANELGQLFNKPAASSFKHTNPTGAAIAIDWNLLPSKSQYMLTEMYGVNEFTPPSVNAYARARNADPQSSFGDFIGFSGIVDTALAEFISNQISDGIIAAGYSDEALTVLRKKKKGNFIILEAQPKQNKDIFYEFRDLPGFPGLSLGQLANEYVISREDLTRNIPTKNKNIPEESLTDLLIANACMKYAQSNNVACASQSQLIGLAAGQQSRVGAVELVMRKVNCWINRHDLVEKFKTLEGTRQSRIIMTTEIAANMSIREPPSDLSLASDGFFPFADNIKAAAPPIKYISQPGGSIQDQGIVDACDDAGIAMTMTGVRVFTH